MPGRTTLCLALLASLLPAAAGRADELHFLIVFGSGDRPGQHAHTFAAFVKAVGQGPALDRYALEVFSLSWVPETLKVRVLWPCDEPGRNLNLQESLDWAARHDAPIAMWGPYQIQPDLYQRARAQYELLESGAVRYKAVSAGRHRNRHTNCIHAVADLAGSSDMCKPAWGEPASYFTMLKLLPFVIDCQHMHDWLIPALGLDAWLIQPRGLEENPEPRLLRRAIQNGINLKLIRQVP